MLAWQMGERWSRQRQRLLCRREARSQPRRTMHATMAWMWILVISFFLAFMPQGLAFQLSTMPAKTISTRLTARLPVMRASLKDADSPALGHRNSSNSCGFGRAWSKLRPMFQPRSLQTSDITPATSATTFRDAWRVMRSNIMQAYYGQPSYDGAPHTTEMINPAQPGALFLGLQIFYHKYGSVYKLLFGPKSFMVVSDPVVIKHILRDNAKAYDKGILAEILEPILGKGLIPADLTTWKARRRAIVPGFHQAWYASMINRCVQCNMPLLAKLEQASGSNVILNMETEFCSVSLDIIGKAVFNYDFQSVTKESPVIQAVYSVLQEAEHRSMTPIPYWQLPGARLLIPRLRRFHANIELLNRILDELIQNAMSVGPQPGIDINTVEWDATFRQTCPMRSVVSSESGTCSVAVAEVTTVSARINESDPSLLRFLVDMRGENITSRQLRDDLMTLLVAGHETTAAVLTWALYELSRQPALLSEVRQQLDAVLPLLSQSNTEAPVLTADLLSQLSTVRLIIAETLRMYPQPPLLIRRAIEDDVWPSSTGTAHYPNQTRIMRGTDIFLAIYNIHRSADYWDNPNLFDPSRFLRPQRAPTDRPDWNGYQPHPSLNSTTGAPVYPNEVHSHFAYLPFGAGMRKCIGDQLAYMEITITLALILQRYDFEFVGRSEDVGMTTGATIHTKNGLMMRVKPRAR